MSVLYGSHMAMRTVMDRNIVSKAQRMHGKSHHFGLMLSMGKFETMELQDTMSDPYQQPELDKEPLHNKLQKIYCMWVSGVWDGHIGLIVLKLKTLKKLKLSTSSNKLINKLILIIIHTVCILWNHWCFATRFRGSTLPSQVVLLLLLRLRLLQTRIERTCRHLRFQNTTWPVRILQEHLL